MIKKSLVSASTICNRISDDLMGYESALNEWDTHETDNVNVLLETMLRRGRAYEGLSILKQVSAKPNAKNIYLFDERLAKNDSKLIEITNSQEHCAQILNEATKRLDYLDALLYKIQSTYNERIIYSDDTLRDVFKYQCLEFLTYFIRNKYLAMQSELFVTIPKEFVQNFIKRLSEIENIFRAKFYLFFPLKNIIKRYKKDFYNDEDRWWFSSEPPMHEPNDEIISSVIVDGIRGLLKDRPLLCPDTKTLAAYSFYELSMTERKKVNKHVTECPECLIETILMRYVDAVTCLPNIREVKQKKNITIPAEIFRRISPHYLDINALIRNAIGKSRNWLAGKLHSIFCSLLPGEQEFIFECPSFRGISTEKTTLQKVWWIRREKTSNIALIKHPEEELPNIKPLSMLLNETSFYFFMFGLGMNNELKTILPGIQFKDYGDLPLEIEEEDLQDVDILSIVIHVNKDIINEIYKGFQNSFKKGEIYLPVDKVMLYITTYIG
ncbi:MAG: hypothetical protein KA807_10610 [Prolixibacteraceae bacterium]|nr:hypothetical protein [Prolixibacteraceae bacterium]